MTNLTLLIIGGLAIFTLGWFAGWISRVIVAKENENAKKTSRN